MTALTVLDLVLEHPIISNVVGAPLTFALTLLVKTATRQKEITFDVAIITAMLWPLFLPIYAIASCALLACVVVCVAALPFMIVWRLATGERVKL